MANEDKNKQATEVSKKKREVTKARKARRFVIPRVHVPRPSTVAFVLPSYHVASAEVDSGLDSRISHTEYADNSQQTAYVPGDTEGNQGVHPEPTPYIAGGDYQPQEHPQSKGNHHFTHANHYGKPVTPVTGIPTTNYGQTNVVPNPVIASHSGGHKDYSYLTPPVVGQPQSGTVTEDTTLVTSGTVDIQSAQKGSPLTFTPDNLHGQYGEFTLNKDTGEWSYSLDNAHNQNLAQGETHTEILHVTVTSAAGVSVHQDITITVQGTNDIPVITSQAQHGVTKEDGVLLVDGQVTATDVDHGAALTYSANHLVGNYGSFTLDSATGKWTYTLDSQGHQELSEGESHSEFLEVTVTDEHGATTTQRVEVVVEGTNDQPIIDVILPQHAKEDGVIVHSQIHSVDVDTLDTATFSTTASVPGFQLNPDGTYSFDPSDTAYQHLAEGQKQTITIPVTVTDPHQGSDTKDLVITVTGTNDNPILTVGSTTPGGGRLTQTDVDDGDTHTFAALDQNSPQALVHGQFGDLNVDPKTGLYTYVPHASVAGMGYDKSSHQYHGHEYFAVQVADNHGGTDTKYITFEVTATAGAPTQPGGPAVITTQVVNPQTPQITDVPPTLAPLQTPTNAVTIDLAATSDTGSSDHDDRTSDTTPLITGQTDIPFSVVTIYDHGQEVAKVTSDQNGIYQVDTSALTGSNQGEAHDLIATAVAPSAGSANSVSSSFLKVIVDTGVTATDETNTATEDQTAVVNGHLSLATDTGGDAEVTTVGDIPGQYGTYHLNKDGSYSYTLDNTNPAVQAFAEGTSHKDPIQYSVIDAAGNTATAQLEVTITGTNDDPVLSVGVQTLATGGLTETDVDTGDTHTFEILDAGNPVQTITGQYGDLVLDATTGHYTYTPHSGVQGMGYDPQTHEYRGHEAFHVQVSDNHGGTDDKYLTFEVAATVAAPTKPGDPGVITTKVVPPTNPTSTGTPTPLQQVTDTAPQLKPFPQPPANTVTLDLTDGSDSGKSHTDDLTSDQTPTVTGHTAIPFSVVTISDHGNTVATVTSDSNGDYTATLPTMAGSEGGIVHDLMATAQAPSTGTASVTHSANLDVTIDTGVTATDETNTATEDQSAVVNGQLSLATDTGGDAEVTTVGDIPGQYGTYHLNKDGSYSYTLDNTNPAVQAFAEGTSHKDPIQYSVIDAAGNTATAQLEVTITGTNDDPVLSVGVQTPATGGLTETDVDTGDTHTFEILDAGKPVQTITGQYGDLVLDSTTGHYTYTPHSGVQGMGYDPQTHEYRGHEAFHVQVSDNHGGTDDKYLTFEVAATVAAPTKPGDPGVITTKVVTPTDPTGTGTPLPQVTGTGPQSQPPMMPSGTNMPLPQVTDTAPQLKPFPQPPANTVTIDLTDGSDSGKSHTDDLTSDQTPTVTGHTAIPFSVVTISDQGNIVATVTSDSNGDYTATLPTMAGSEGGIVHDLMATAQAPSTGTANVTHSANLDVTIDTGVTATDEANTATEDQSAVVQGQLPLATDTGGDAEVTTVGDIPGQYGTYHLNKDGSYSYTLDNTNPAVQAFTERAAHKDPIQYSVTDAAGNTATAQLEVTITGTNDAPVLSVGVQTPATGGLTETDVDTGDSHTFEILDVGNPVQTIAGQFGDLTLDKDSGHYTYVPHPGVQGMGFDSQTGEYHGHEYFQVQVSDNHGGTDNKFLTFETTATVTAPTLPGQPPQINVQVVNPQTPQVTDTAPTLSPLTPPTNAVDIDLAISSDSMQAPNQGTGTHTDDLTNDATPAITGTTGIPFSKVEIKEGGSVIATIYSDASGRYSVDLPTQTNGVHTLTSTATAPSSTNSVVSSTLPVTIDTVAPVLTIDPIATDNVVNAAEHAAAVTISGATDAEVGQIVTVHVGPSNAGHDYLARVSAGATGQNVYSVDVPAGDIGALQDGRYAISASVADKAGNLSTAAHGNVEVDTTSTQVISGAQGDVVEDVTTTVSYPLTVPNGESVTWDASNAQQGTFGEFTFDQNSGQWTYTLDHNKTDHLQQGETPPQETFMVTGTDAQGNPVQQQITVQVTGTNDDPVLTVNVGAGLVMGTLSETDVDTKDDHVFSIVDGGAQVNTLHGQFGDLTLDPSSGVYTYTPHADVSGMSYDAATHTYQGKEYFQVQVDDGHGGIDTKYIEFDPQATVAAPTTGTGAPVITSSVTTQPKVTDTPPTLANHVPSNAVTLDLAATSDSGASDHDDVTNEQMPTFTGHTDIPFSKVEIRDGSTVVATTYSDKDGNYQVVASQLADPQTNPQGQNHNLVATATAPSTTTGVTAVLDVRVDTLAHAKDDVDQITEDSNRDTTSGNLLTNDELHSDITAVETTTGGSHQVSGGAVTVKGQYGTFTINPDGTYSYQLDNSNPDVQALAQSAHIDDVLTYHTTDLAGNPTQAQLIVTVNGTNDDAVIGGVDKGDVKEDLSVTGGLLKMSGQLTISDVDKNPVDEATFQTTVTPNTNAWGHLTVDKSGQWNYEVNNQDPRVQALQEGDTHTDTFTVMGTDGTAHDVLVTVTGTKDAPEITQSAESGAVTEAGSTPAGTPITGVASATGQFARTDVDTQDSATWSIVAGAQQAQTNSGNVQGTYGHLEIDQNGKWTYVLDNNDPDTQALTDGQSEQELFTVRVTDSTGLTDEQTVTVEVTGSNDQAQITGTDSRHVKEDENLQGGKLHTSGTLSVTDVDTGEDHFTASTLTGTYGELALQQDGSWTYDADNNQVPIQQLKATDHLTDVFTITSADGTEHTITVTIDGTNDLPTIAGTDTGAVVEKGNHADANHRVHGDPGTPTATGQLSATEVDANDPAHWAVPHGQGTYGSLTIDKDGQWTYTLDQSRANSLHEGEVAKETFIVTDTDSSGTPVEHNVVITVTGSNDMPVISGAHSDQVTEAGGTANAQAGKPTIAGDLSAADPDNNDQGNLVWSIENAPSGTPTQRTGRYGTLKLDQHGHWCHWIYELNNDDPDTQKLQQGHNPTDKFTVLVTDSSGASVTKEVVVAVHGTNDDPVLAAYTPQTFGEDSGRSHQQTISLPHVSDVDDTALTYSIDDHIDTRNAHQPWIEIDPVTGQITVKTNAKVLQHLAVGEQTTEDVLVTVTDAHGGTTQQTLHLTITGSNDAPHLTQLKVEDSHHRLGHQQGMRSTGKNAHQPLLSIDEDSTLRGKILFSDVDDAQGTQHLQGDTHTFSATVEYTDEKGQQRTVTLTEAGLTINNDGTFELNAQSQLYQHLQKGQTAHLDVLVTVTDGQGASDSQHMKIAVHGQNDNPTVTQVHPMQMDEDTHLQFTLGGTGHPNWGQPLVSVTDVENDRLDISNPQVDPKYGTLVDHGMGRFEFIPATNQNFDTFRGDVPITFDIDDNHGGTATETGFIHVNPVNDDPAAGNIHLPGIAEDSGPVHITEAQLLANTHDIDNSHSELHISGTPTLSDPSAGTLIGDAQHGWTFTPALNWNSDKAGHNLRIEFSVSDGAGGHATAHAIQKVTPVQDPAVIVDDIGHTQDKVVTDGSGSSLKAEGYLSITDPDLNEEHFQVRSSIQGHHGFASIDRAGHWEYTLNPKDPAVLALGEGETLTDTFVVHGADGTPHTVSIEVTGKNEAPTVTSVDTTSTKEGDAAVHGFVHAHDSDVHDDLHFAQTGSLLAGFSINPDTGKFHFDPSHPIYNEMREGETRILHASVEVTDGNGGKTVQDVAIEIVGTNDAPAATGVPLPDIFRANSGINPTVTFHDQDFLDRATDPDKGDVLSIGKFTATLGGHVLSDVTLHDPHSGTLTQDGAGGYVFTPATGFTGPVQIDYVMTDGKASTKMHTSFSVLDAPSTNQQTPHFPGQNPSTTTWATLTPAQPVVVDKDIFDKPLYKGNINEGGTTTTGHVHETHTGPHSGHSEVHGDNHLDPDARTDGLADLGYLQVTPDGAWTYHLHQHNSATDPVNQLALGESLTETFTLHSDHGETKVEITIHGTNDAPEITGHTTQVADLQGTAVPGHPAAIAEVDTTELIGTVTATDVDHGDALTFGLGATPKSIPPEFLEGGHLAGLSINPRTGEYTFVPDSAHYGSIPPGQTRTFQVPVTVMDNNGATSTQNIELTVEGHNRPPEVLHTDVTLTSHDEDFGKFTVSTQEFLKLAGASDPDGDALHITNLHVTDANGHVVAVQDDGHGNFVFTSQQDQHGDVHFSFEVTDGMSQSRPVTATLPVSSVNDAPTASDFNLPNVAESTTSTPTPSGVFTEQDFVKHAADVDIATDQDVLSLVGEPTLAPLDAIHGRIEKNGSGWQFVPNDANFNGQIHIQYTVTDKAKHATSTATATLLVTPTNDPAFIDNPTPDFVKEDGKAHAQGTLTISDVDVTKDDHSQETFHANSHIGGSYGYLELDTQGHWEYTMTRGDRAGVQQLSEGGKLTEHFTVTSKDGTTYDLTVDIKGTNDDPILTAITAAKGNEGGSTISGDLSGFATDVDTEGTRTADNPADVLTYHTGYSHPGFKLDSATGHYTLDLTDPSFEHLAQGETKVLTVPITVQDHHGGHSQTRNLKITVTGTNDVPVLTDIPEITANEDDAVIHGQFTSTDVDSDNLNNHLTHYQVDGGAQVAGFHLNRDGSYTFDPGAYNNLQAGETKDVTIPIVATDNHGNSASKNLVVHLTGTNDAATITGTDTATLIESVATDDTTITALQQLSVTDPDHDESHFTAGDINPDSTTAATGLQQTAYGHLSITADGKWQYHVDDADAVKAIPGGQTVQETFIVTSVDGTPHTVTVTLQGSNEAATFSGRMTGAVTDGTSTSASGNITVTDVDYGESGKMHTTAHHTATNTDSAGHTAGVATTQYGHIDIDQSGAWTYQVDHLDKLQAIPEGVTVTETFTVTAADGTPQQITITLTGSNDAPTVTGAVSLGHATEDTPITYTKAELTANAHDLDSGDVLSIENPSVPASAGTVALDSSGGIVFTPVANFNGDVTVTYDVVDSHGAKVTTTATFTVDKVADPAVIGGTVTGTATEDGSATASGTLTITDADSGEDHFAAGIVPGTYGSLDLKSDGQWTYTLDNANQNVQQLGAGVPVTDTITVQSADGTTQDITVTITGTNDAPTVSQAVTLPAQDEDTTFSIRKGQLLHGSSDADQDGLTVSGVSVDHGSLTHHGNRWDYTPEPNYHGPVVVSYHIEDGHGGSVAQTASMQINSVNDPAQIGVAASALVREDSPTGKTAGTLSIVDPDGSSEEVFTAATGLHGQYGDLDIDEHGHWGYTMTKQSDPAIQGLKEGETLIDKITVHSQDGTAYEVQVQISGENDKPTVTATPGLVEHAGQGHSFKQADFGFHDIDGDSLDHITITSLPDAVMGQLMLNGHAVTAHQVIAQADLTHLTFENAQIAQDGQVATFQYTANDGHEDSDPATLSLTMHPTQPIVVTNNPAPPPPPPVSADEPDTGAVDQAPIITLQDIATAAPISSGAQAYLNQIGVDSHANSLPDHAAPSDMDIVLAGSSDVTLDEHGLVVSDADSADATTADDHHKHHEELQLHDDLTVDHHDWTDNHG